MTIEIKLNIRFSDTDAMGIVWHGNYLRFFEDGREAFGEAYGLRYLDMYAAGYFTPIVKSEIDHKAPINFGDEVVLITNYVQQRAAKLVFDYEIKNLTTGEVSATGRTIQVFLKAKERELELNTPTFFEEWKKKYLTAI